KSRGRRDGKIGSRRSADYVYVAVPIERQVGRAAARTALRAAERSRVRYEYAVVGQPHHERIDTSLKRTAKIGRCCEAGDVRGARNAAASRRNRDGRCQIKSGPPDVSCPGERAGRSELRRECMTVTRQGGPGRLRKVVG